jgi:hypothetical protein
MPNKKGLRSQNSALQDAAGDLTEFSEGRRAALLREREIALHFGNLRIVLKRTSDIRKLHEDLLRRNLKGSVGNRIRSDRSADPTATIVVNHMEEDTLFVRNLKRAVWQYGDLDLLEACAAELAILERHVAILKSGGKDQRARGIIALMGAN